MEIRPLISAILHGLLVGLLAVLSTIGIFFLVSGSNVVAFLVGWTGITALSALMLVTSTDTFLVLISICLSGSVLFLTRFLYSLPISHTFGCVSIKGVCSVPANFSYRGPSECTDHCAWQFCCLILCKCLEIRRRNCYGRPFSHVFVTSKYETRGMPTNLSILLAVQATRGRSFSVQQIKDSEDT